jgi:hypothetical protein
VCAGGKRWKEGDRKKGEGGEKNEQVKGEGEEGEETLSERHDLIPMERPSANIIGEGRRGGDTREGEKEGRKHTMPAESSA